MAGGADGCTGTACHADLCLGMKGRVDSELQTSSGQSDGAVSHLFADPGTEPAEDAVVILGFEPGRLDTVFFCQILQQRYFRAPGIQHFDDQFASFVNGLRIRFDFHSFPYGIVAGGHEPGSASIKEFHRADSAHAGRFQGLVMTKRWDVDTEFFGHLKDILPFFSLYFFPI